MTVGRMPVVYFFLLLTFLLSSLVGCTFSLSGIPQAGSTNYAAFELGGRLSAGDINGASVDAFQDGEWIGHATSNAAGLFTMTVNPKNNTSPIKLVGTGGTYYDETTGALTTSSTVVSIVTKFESNNKVGVNGLTTLITKNLMNADNLNAGQMEAEIAVATTAALNLLGVSGITIAMEAANSSAAPDVVTTNAGKLRRLMAAISFASNGAGVTAANLPHILAVNLKNRTTPSMALTSIASFMADPESTKNPVMVIEIDDPIVAEPPVEIAAPAAEDSVSPAMELSVREDSLEAAPEAVMVLDAAE